MRFEQIGSMDDLNRAIELAERAVKATPGGHSGQVGFLINLGKLLGIRFQQIGSIDDLSIPILPILGNEVGPRTRVKELIVIPA